MSRLLPLILCALLSFASGEGLAQTPRELVVNGEFAFSGGEVSGWFVGDDVRAKGRIAPSGDLSRNGKAALELAPNAKNTPGPQPLGIGQIIAAQPVRGSMLQVSVWLAARDGAAAVVGIAVLRKNGSEAATSFLRRTSTATAELEHFEAEIEVPTQADIENIIVFAAAEGTRGRAYFSELSLTSRTSAARAPSGTPPPTFARSAPAAPVHARVEIDAAQLGRRVPRELYGTNVEWIRDGNGLWNRQARALDARITDLTRKAGVTLIRFPGGAWSDYYFWRDGIGGRPEARPRKPHFPGDDEQSQHVFGTDEALAFAKAVDGRLLITVNAGTGTPELAAEWVRYVNGDGGRAPRVARVDHWEVGNELYHDGDISGGTMPPLKYAEKLRSFATAMRAVDPAIKIGAIGLENFGRLQFNSYPDWNRIVLRAAADQIDFFAVHNGYAPVAQATEGADPRDVYQAMLAYPVLAGRNLATTAAQIAEVAPAHAGRIRLAVTEWGPLFAIDPKSRWLDHVKTLGSGVFVASMLKAMVDSPQTDIATFFKLSEHGFMGWIGRRAGAPAANAPLLAFELWAKDFGDRLVAVRTESPTYDSKAIGWVDRVTGVPIVEASASLTADGLGLRVIAINKHLSQPASVVISLAGFAASGDATIRLLSGDGPDAHVGTELPRIPGLAWGRQASIAGGFERGRPDAVSLVETKATAAANGMTVSLPPSSVAAIAFVRRR